MKDAYKRIVFVLALFLVAAMITTKKVRATNTVVLTVDRESVNYLFNLPEAYTKDCLAFKCGVRAHQSYAGELIVLQFSHDHKEWNNLASTIVDSNGTATFEQPVDSSWAINGPNYLRVVVNNQVSDTVLVRVNVGFGYWIFGAVLSFFSLVIVVWYSVKKKWIKEPYNLEKLRKVICSYVSGREQWLYPLVGLLIRIPIAPFTEQRFDSYVSRLWPTLLYGYRLYPFEPMMPAGYPLILRYSFPPIWFFVSAFSFFLWWIIAGFKFPVNPELLWKHGEDIGNIFESYRSFVPSTLPLLDLILKTPIILADVGIGYLILYFAKGKKQKKLVLFLWILNPLVIQISTVLGQFDAISTFFTLCSLYFLRNKRLLVSAIFLSLGVGTKLYPAFFLIPFLIYFHKREKLNERIKYLSAAILSGVFIFGTFLVFPGGFDFLHRLFFFKSSPDWYGKNLFAGLTWQRFFSIFQWGGNLPIFPLIFVPVYSWLCYIFWKGKKDFDSLMICITSILLLIYLSYSVVNPQYALWALPFLLYLHLQGRFSRKLYVAFSAVPLVYLYGYYNPLQFISPVIVWQEWNYQPWSDLVLQLWPYLFSDVSLNFLAMCLFPFTVLISLLCILQGQTSDEQARSSHIDDNTSKSKKTIGYNGKSVCIIIPTLNEKENVEKLVKEIEKIECIDHVLIVDDGSTDGTLYCVDELMKIYDNVRLIERRRKMGIGSAIREGFRKSLMLNPVPEYIITMDADLSHDPKAIPKLVECSRMSRSCIVVGSRYVPGGLIKGWSWNRRLVSTSANALTRLMLRIPIKDCTSGFKCYRLRAIETLLPSLIGEAYEFQVETLHEAKKNRLSLTEIPITFIERRDGRSKFGAKEVFRFLLYIVRNAFQ